MNVASRLCEKEMKVPMRTPGIDEKHWMKEADSILWPFVERVRMGYQRRSAK